MSDDTMIYGYREVLAAILEIHAETDPCGRASDLEKFFEKYSLTLVQALGGPYHCDLCGMQYFEYKMCCKAREEYLAGFREPPLKYPDELNPAVQMPLIMRRLRPIGESPKTIADEMEAWSEKKMTASGSSRIDRTLVREWAKRLRGEA